jgi:arsenite methyltransferase
MAGKEDSKISNPKIHKRGAYGIDAPALLPISGVLLASTVISAITSASAWPLIGTAVIVVFIIFAYYASTRGKFIVWVRLIDELGLHGDEQILDVGCGRGTLLMIAAQHLTTGKAFGIDIWKRSDQSGNSIQATDRNSKAEGVEDRVELRTADMTSLPFEDNSFDLVVSNLAIHNVSKEKRDIAIQEVVRVVKPGGRVMIADIMGASQYVRKLKSLGINNVTERDLGWRMWWSGPWARTILVSCTKQGEP